MGADEAIKAGVMAVTVATWELDAVTPRTTTFAHRAPAFAFVNPATVTPNALALTAGDEDFTTAVIAPPDVAVPAALMWLDAGFRYTPDAVVKYTRISVSTVPKPLPPIDNVPPDDANDADDGCTNGVVMAATMEPICTLPPK